MRRTLVVIGTVAFLGLTILLGAVTSVIEYQESILASQSQATSQLGDGGNLSGDFLEIYQFFKGKGLEDIQIAAIFGNMYAESGGIDWTAVETVFDEPYTIGEKKKRATLLDFRMKEFNAAYWSRFPAIQYAGIGLCQWTNGRNRQLLAYAKEKNTEWYHLQTQLEFFWMECDKASNTGAADNQWFRGVSWEDFLSEKDLKTATKKFMVGFEGILTDSLIVRQKKAEEFYQQMQSGTLSGGMGEITYSGTVTKKMQDIATAAAAGKSTFPCTQNYCAAWVSGVYQAAGYGSVPGNAIDMWNNFKQTGSTDMKNIPPGAIVCSSGWGSMGATYGHVGIYLGNGKIANNKGYFAVETIEEYLRWNTATCQGHTGWIGWVMPGGF